jgi:hypothetical protein
MWCRYAAIYVAVLVILFSVTQKKSQILRWIYWTFDQNPRLHRLRFTEQWGTTLVSTMRTLRRQPVCVLVRTDDVSLVQIYISGRCTNLFADHILDQFIGPKNSICQPLRGDELPKACTFLRGGCQRHPL